MSPAKTPPFPCFCCGECCSRYQALITPAEVARLAERLGLSPVEFAARYTDPRWPGTREYLLRHNEGGCVLLTRQDKAVFCAVHDIKPQVCRDWEAGADKRECREGLARCWGLQVSADGAVVGEAGRLKAFRAFLKKLGAGG